MEEKKMKKYKKKRHTDEGRMSIGAPTTHLHLHIRIYIYIVPAKKGAAPAARAPHVMTSSFPVSIREFSILES